MADHILKRVRAIHRLVPEAQRSRLSTMANHSKRSSTVSIRTPARHLRLSTSSHRSRSRIIPRDLIEFTPSVPQPTKQETPSMRMVSKQTEL